MPSNRYQELNSLRVTETITTLRDLISNRFPQSGLSQVSEELLEIAKTADLNSGRDESIDADEKFAD